jgi:glutamine synthetase
LPRNLKEATDEFKKPGSLARELLGDGFVDHFAGTREHEWDVFIATVTNWDLQRYLELV